MQSEERNEAANGSSSAPKQSSMESPNRLPAEISNETQTTRKPFSRSLISKPKSRKSFNRSVLSKPKSRFGEPSVPIDSDLFEESYSVENSPSNSNTGSFNRANNNSPDFRTVSISSAWNPDPVMASPGRAKAKEEDEKFYKVIRVLIEWTVFLGILGVLVASLTVEKLEKLKVWGLEFWKWCVLLMVVFGGTLLTYWFTHFIVLFTKRNILLKKKLLYYVYGVKKSVQVFMWLALVLLTWLLLFNPSRHEIKRSKTRTKILKYVTWTLASAVIGAFLWLLKTLLFKIVALKFHLRHTYFDRVQESIFHQYILQTLSGPPVIEEAKRIGRSPSTGQLSIISTRKVIDVGKLQKMKQVSASTMEVLVDALSSSAGLSTFSYTLDQDRGVKQKEMQIVNEIQAIAAASHIFTNVAQRDYEYIEEDDLRRFMINEDVELVFRLIDVGETGKFDKRALTDWVVKVYNGRKALDHALTDTKAAVKQLNEIVTGILIVIIIVVWLILMEVATTKVLVFISSQLVLAAFIFGNTCKNIFEAIVFVFVIHPFDVGDRCLVDGVPLRVEEMNILTTVFLKLNNERVYYPNSVLSTKTISNYYRSSDMGDTVDFSIDVIPVDRINLMKAKIKSYLESNPQYWHPDHNVVVIEIENVNKLKMALYFNHTMNFQEFREINKRRSELVIELMRIFEELNIPYNLLPHDVSVA
ncbi:mechanosensitive ion channel protein 10-like [Rosa sericea]